MGFVLTIGKYLTIAMEWLMEKVAQENKVESKPDRLQRIITIIAGYAIAIILAVSWYNYTDTKDRIRGIEERVSFLYQDKVSRAEFREEMTQMRLQIEATKTDIIAIQEATKSDILARIDLLIPHITRAKDK
jgi:hypothetical protein